MLRFLDAKSDKAQTDIKNTINPKHNGRNNMDAGNITVSNNSTTDTITAQVVYQKKGLPEDKNAIVAHASRISGNDLDFLALLDSENAGTWDTHVKNWNRNGTYDQGICQFNSQYFMHIINDPQFSNPEWQVNRCHELYTTWKNKGILAKRFFAWPKRHKSKINFYLNQT